MLIVDDEGAIRSLGARALMPRHTVHQVAGGRDALELLQTLDPVDVVLCDLMMPDKSGMELYREVVAARPELRDRFVFMTGGGYTAEAVAFVAETPCPVLQKPMGAAALRDAVARVLAGGVGFR